MRDHARSGDLATPRGAGSPRAGCRAAGRALVVGCGNWASRDDRVGPRVVSALKGRLGRGVTVRDVGTTTLGLLDLLDGQELLVLVDACAGRGRPGEVLVVEPDLHALVPERVGTHQIGPVETLVVARELYPERLPRRTVLVLVETGGLAAGAEADARRRASEAFIRTIRGFRGEGTGTEAAPAA